LAYLIIQALALFGGWLLVLHLGLLVEERTSNETVIEGYLAVRSRRQRIWRLRVIWHAALPSETYQKPPHKRFPKFGFTLAIHRHYTALERLVANRLAGLVERVSDARLKFYVGIGWAAVGGALSGGSLVLAKAVVMIGMGEGNVVRMVRVERPGVLQ
jgi:hypothetical protein